MNQPLFDAVSAQLRPDVNRWPDRHGDYHADCPYCGKAAKKGQTHFRISRDGLCYCQVCQQGTALRALADHLRIEIRPMTNGATPSPQTEYDYYDAGGVLAYQAVRYLKQGKKSFYQRHLNGDGGWVNGMNGVDRVLYRLPEVLAAVAANQPIYIVEGEKDVETLRLRSLTATTNVGGAGKWQPVYGDVLKGATVFILPDNDKPGEEHAQQIKRALQGIAKSARIVRLPDLAEKEDVSDWLAKGHTVEELKALTVEREPKAKPATEYVTDWSKSGTTAAELQRKVFTPLRWIIDGILPESACLFAAKPKSKKSWFALACAVAVALGGKVLGHYDVTKGRVLVLDLESNQRRMKDRLGAIIGSQVAWPENLHIYTEWPKGDEGIAMLDAWMDTHPDTNLVVIDIFENFRSPRDPKGNPYEQDYAAAKALNAFAERHRIALIVIHHTRKAKADDVFDEISGTNGISGGFASMWILSRTNDNGQDEQIFAIRGRDISDDEPKAVKWDGYTCQHILVATGREVSSSAGRRAILGVMEDDQEYQLKEIATLVNKTVSAVSNQMKRLMDDNLIHRVGNGRYAKVMIQDESSERHESSGSSGRHESSGSDYANMHITPLSLSHDFHMDDVKVDSASESPKEALNGDFHDFHVDSSRGLIDRLKPHSVFAGLNKDQYSTLRSYLRSNKETDQDRARELCAEYAIDYDQARKAVA